MIDIIREKLKDKQIFIYFGIAIFLSVVVIVFIFLLFFRSRALQEESPILPEPTQTNKTEGYNTAPDGSFRFTPYQKTEINKSTDADIQEKYQILEKKQRPDGVTVYKVPSAVVSYEDQIWTKNNKVVFEKNNTFVQYRIPKLAAYKARFGEPEAILEGIQPFGHQIDAYIYASKGFTLIVNPNSDSYFIYEIQRYTPMSVEEYKKQFSEFVQHAEPVIEYPR